MLGPEHHKPQEVLSIAVRLIEEKKGRKTISSEK